MKKWAIVGGLLCFILLVISCKKENTKENADMVPIIYEAETSAPGLTLQINEYVKTSSSEGVELKPWIVNGKGLFDTTVYIKKGFAAKIYGVHPTSTDWKIRIKKPNGFVLVESKPDQSISGSDYSTDATVVVD